MSENVREMLYFAKLANFVQRAVKKRLLAVYADGARLQ